LGDTVKGGGYALTVVQLEDPTTPSQFYEPTPGTKLVAVEIIVGNESGEEIGTNPLDATLVDNQGFLHTPELGGRHEGQLELVDLAPGQRVQGWIAFEIPSGRTVASVKFEMIGFSGPTLEAPVGPSSVQTPVAGNTVREAGYALTAVRMEDPTDPSQFYDPTPGTKLVAVDIVVANESAEAITTNPLDATLVDNQGFVHTVQLGGRDGGQLQLVRLEPGERVQGWVSFELPVGRSAEVIQFEMSFSGPTLEAEIP
jgi:hypothetical protein